MHPDDKDSAESRFQEVVHSGNLRSRVKEADVLIPVARLVVIRTMIGQIRNRGAVIFEYLWSGSLY